MSGQTLKGTGVPPLPPVKRYITTHDASGKSIYAESPEESFWEIPGGTGAACRSYAVDSVPANLADDVDLQAYKAKDGNVTSFDRREVVLPQPGVNCVVVDLAPGAVSSMHRTVSIDFSICVIGEIDHELDNGEVVRLRPGDHIVQRGTMHRWINASNTEPARFVACTVPCVPISIGGKQLEEEWQAS